MLLSRDKLLPQLCPLYSSFHCLKPIALASNLSCSTTKLILLYNIIDSPSGMLFRKCCLFLLGFGWRRLSEIQRTFVLNFEVFASLFVQDSEVKSIDPLDYHMVTASTWVDSSLDLSEQKESSSGGCRQKVSRIHFEHNLQKKGVRYRERSQRKFLKKSSSVFKKKRPMTSDKPMEQT